MKKIITAFPILFAAFVTNAAVANWSFGALNIYDGKGASAEKVTIGTVGYLFDASVLSQSALYNVFADAVKNGTADTLALNKVDGYVATSAAFTSAGSLPTTMFSYGEQGGGEYSYFFAIVSGDAIYLSSAMDVVSNDGEANKSIPFGNQAPASGASSKFMTDGYEAPGQWARGEAPEPTTCSLFLVGLAGIGLKRLRKRGKKSA